MMTKQNAKKRIQPLLKLLHCSLTPEGINTLRLTVNFNGKRIFRRFRALDHDRAIDLCRRQNTAIDRGEGLIHEISGEKLHRQIGIEEAFSVWIESLADNGRNKQYLLNSTNSAKRFCKWMRTEHPAAKCWNELTRKHVESYLKYLDQDGRTKDAVRNAIQPIRATAAFVERELDIPDVCKKASLTIKAKAKEQGSVLEDSRELLRFLEWLRTENPAIHEVALLTGLCGLRVLEATALRYCDIDLEQGKIKITETDTHKPKNAGSYRTIPVCRIALEFLDAKVRRHGGNSEDTICKSAKGLPLNRDNTAYRSMTERVMKQARELGLVPKTFKFKDLRKSFASIAACQAKIPDHYLQRYMGHAGNSVLRTNYIRMEQSLKEGVIKPLDSVFRTDSVHSENPNIKAACIYQVASA